jgi:hypothetical protein
VVLINTRTAAIAVPVARSALLSMLIPHHFADPDFMANIAPDLYACGSEQTRALLSGLHHMLKPGGTFGYYLQLLGLGGWTSIHRLKHSFAIAAFFRKRGHDCERMSRSTAEDNDAGLAVLVVGVQH